MLHKVFFSVNEASTSEYLLIFSPFDHFTCQKQHFHIQVDLIFFCVCVMGRPERGLCSYSFGQFLFKGLVLLLHSFTVAELRAVYIFVSVIDIKNFVCILIDKTFFCDFLKIKPAVWYIIVYCI